MVPTWLFVSGGFVVLAIVFWPLERLFAAIPGQSFWRRDSGTDLIYWVFTNTVTKSLTRLIVMAAITVPLAMLGQELNASLVRRGFGPISRQPRGLILGEVLILGDFLGYLVHRWMHGRLLWKIHAVHHSPRQLDWLTSVRLHPLADIMVGLAQTVPLAVVGFPPVILAGYLPFLTLYSSMLHANLPWAFGPFRFVLASPAFHRWHHTTEEEGLDKNFAPLFPIWDLLLGTFYMPLDRQPQHFGVHDNGVPEGFLPQLLYPFWSPKSEPLAGAMLPESPYAPVAGRIAPENTINSKAG